jgi:hypothetical protein
MVEFVHSMYWPTNHNRLLRVDNRTVAAMLSAVSPAISQSSLRITGLAGRTTTLVRVARGQALQACEPPSAGIPLQRARSITVDTFAFKKLVLHALTYCTPTVVVNGNRGVKERLNGMDGLRRGTDGLVEQLLRSAYKGDPREGSYQSEFTSYCYDVPCQVCSCG